MPHKDIIINANSLPEFITEERLNLLKILGGSNMGVKLFLVKMTEFILLYVYLLHRSKGL